MSLTCTRAWPYSRCGAGATCPPSVVGHQLHAVADAKHRHAHLEERRIAERRAGFRHALRAAGKDHADGAPRRDCRGGCVERQNLAVHRQFAQASGDELRILRAEIENDDGLVRHRTVGSGVHGIIPVPHAGSMHLPLDSPAPAHHRVMLPLPFRLLFARTCLLASLIVACADAPAGAQRPPSPRAQGRPSGTSSRGCQDARAPDERGSRRGTPALAWSRARRGPCGPRWRHSIRARCARESSWPWTSPRRVCGGRPTSP